MVDGGSSPPSNFPMRKEFVLISFIKPEERNKTLKINISGYVNNIIIEIITSQNDIATFIYAINSIQKLVRLAQVVEQWTGNPEVGGSSPPCNNLIFGCVRNSY